MENAAGESHLQATKGKEVYPRHHIYKLYLYPRDHARRACSVTMVGVSGDSYTTDLCRHRHSEQKKGCIGEDNKLEIKLGSF